MCVWGGGGLDTVTSISVIGSPQRSPASAEQDNLTISFNLSSFITELVYNKEIIQLFSDNYQINVHICFGTQSVDQIM